MTLTKEPIAIVGLGCRYPGGAHSPQAFWDVLTSGKRVTGPIPPERVKLVEETSGRTMSDELRAKLVGGWLTCPIEEFDAKFFGLHPRDAASSDPAHRILLEVAVEAIEDAGIPLEKLAGSKTGVYVGSMYTEYLGMQLSRTELMSSYAPMSLLSLTANRISYVLDLHGPSFTLDTACSSSALAVHLAVQGIRSGDCDAAIAAGVNLLILPEEFLVYGGAGALSPDGMCKTFDSTANGYARAEGVGAILLKPLSKALADGDQIYATILGTASNQDGLGDGTGITVPNWRAHKSLIESALADAGIDDPHLVTYVEAHGTGTAVGDPIEARGIGEALGTMRSSTDHPILTGSLKPNIGHMEAAAGVASVIKMALALKNRVLPPSVNVTTPNPKIAWDELHVQLVRSLQPLPESTPVIVGVNGFGIGGSNAHIVLSTAPSNHPACSVPTPLAASSSKRPYFLLPISSRSADLKPQAAAWRDFSFDPSSRIEDVCWSAITRRTQHKHRLAVCVRDVAEINGAMDAFIQGQPLPGTSTGSIATDAAPPKVCFVFGGQGPQWFAMGRELYFSQPVFKSEIDKIDAALSKYTMPSWSLVSELMFKNEDDSCIGETHIAQPAIFAVQVALASLWRSWGIIPDVCVGHSVGEVAAAFVSGALSFEDAISTIYHRSQLQHKVSKAAKGKMAAVMITEENAREAISGFEDLVTIAAVNSPNSVTLSGDHKTVMLIVENLQRQNVHTTFLRTEGAFHSFHMDPMKEPLLENLKSIRPQTPKIPLYSTVTARRVDGELCDAKYWWSNVRQHVSFASAVRHIAEDFDPQIWLEISPHPVLTQSLTDCLSDFKNRNGSTQSPLLLSSLKRKSDEQLTMLSALSALYTAGVAHIDWTAVLGLQSPRSLVSLPRYVWNHERYWLDIVASLDSHSARPATASASKQAVASSVHSLLGTKVESVSTHVWENTISTKHMPWIADHAVQGVVLFPATGFIEVAVAAVCAQANASSGTSNASNDTRQCVQLSDVTFHSAMTFSDSKNTAEERVIQIVLTPLPAGQNDRLRWRFTINSRTASSSSPIHWSLHVSGDAEFVPDQKRKINIEELRQRCHVAISSENVYPLMEANEHQYGPHFQGIAQAWGDAPAPKTMIADLQLAAPAGKFHVYPALSDTALQLIVLRSILAKPTSDRVMFLPIRVQQIQVHLPSTSPIEVPSCYQSLAYFHTYAAAGLDSYGNPPKSEIQLIDPESGLVMFECNGVSIKSMPIEDKSLKTYDVENHVLSWEWTNSPLAHHAAEANLLSSPSEVIEATKPHISEAKQRRQYYVEETGPHVDELVTLYLVHALKQIFGWEFKVDETIHVPAFNESKIASEHWRLFARILEVLQEDGIFSSSAKHEDNDDENNPPFDPFTTPSEFRVLRDVPIDRRQLRERNIDLSRKYPTFVPTFELLELCGSRLDQILTGEQAALGIIFGPKGSPFTESIYRDHPVADLLPHAWKSIVQRLATLDVGSRTVLRILEVGAGTGGSTVAVLPVLDSILKQRQAAGLDEKSLRIEYFYTDISNYFMAQAIKRFTALYPFITFKVLDLEKDVWAQGYSAGSFDIVFGANVVHATAYLRESLARIESLLVPGGYIFLQELTVANRFANLVMAGTMPGWWNFRDFDLRRSQPIISPSIWRRIMEESGFGEVSWTETDEQALIIARKQRPRHKERWLLFVDNLGVGERAAQELQARVPDSSIILARHGEQYSKNENCDRFVLREGEKSDMLEMFRSIPPCHRVVFMWSMDVPDLISPDSTFSQEAFDAGISVLQKAEVLACGSIARLVYALKAVKWPLLPHVAIVTCGAQPLSPEPTRTLFVSQSAVVGMFRTLTVELASGRARLIDLDPTDTVQQSGMLVTELLASGSAAIEEEVAFGKDGGRFVNHCEYKSYALENILQSVRPINPAKEADEHPVTMRMQRSEVGSFDALRHVEGERRQPGPGEVEVRVMACGINFRDVLKMLGLHPEATDADMCAPKSDPWDEEDNLLISGEELSGVIAAVGPGVTAFRVGDEVMSWGHKRCGCSTHMTIPLSRLYLKPPHLNFSEAATSLTVFGTAYYALYDLARMQPGERVLIHAAAGGVGLAAIQYCHQAGAEVFATVGSESKREYVRKLGVKHIFNSRDLSFVEGVLEATNGEGVDIVLNSIAGDALQASFALLRDGGRFVEIGKRDIFADNRLHMLPFSKSTSFFAFDLERISRKIPHKFFGLPNIVIPQFDPNRAPDAIIQNPPLKALPVEAFELANAVDALKFMSQAKHIGKVAIRVASSEKEVYAAPRMFRRNGTYIVTGGLGGLGLFVAEWMVVHRAVRSVLLLSRSSPSADLQRRLSQLEKSYGARIISIPCNVASLSDVKRALDRVKEEGLPPIRGIFHGAMQLEPQPLELLEQEKLSSLLRVKIFGAWNLHCLTLGMPIDFFVSFSSVAGVFGDHGQAPYCASNVFLDAFASYRQKLGLPGLSIDLGAVSDVGMLAKSTKMREYLESRGYVPMEVRRIVEVIEQLHLRRPAIPQAFLASTDWELFLRRSPNPTHIVKFGNMLVEQAKRRAAGASASSTSGGAAKAGSSSESSFCSRLHVQACSIFRAKIDDMDINTSLKQFGLDSLVAIEIKNFIEKETGVVIPTMELLKGPSISQLATMVEEAITARTAKQG